jgi:hypothetical protein
MIKLKNIVKSDKKDKKFTAMFEITKDGKTKNRITHFGFENPDDKTNDYTRHGDLERRNRYINRAKSQLAHGDPTRASYLSMFVLWNKPTMKGATKDYIRRLNIYNKTGKFPISDLINQAEKK